MLTINWTLYIGGLKKLLPLHQVTVAHINATSKNAADDKLRQSLRRFAETHTAPATVVLVSCEFLRLTAVYYSHNVTETSVT